MGIQLTVKPSQMLALRLQFPSMMQTVRANIKFQLQERGRALVKAMLGRWQKGRLAASLNVSVSGNTVTMSIGAGLKYTQAVFSGARPHKIEAKGRSPLGWTRFGREFHFWSVNHPGQPARFDILLALQALAKRITREEVKAIFQAISLPGR